MGAVRPAHGSGFRFEAPERNSYFHGQMLGVRQFQLGSITTAGSAGSSTA